MSLLKVGSKGDSVKQLQKQLNGAGYYCSVDGDFGPNTEIAVKNFQRDRSLVSDGEVGRKTRAALLNKDTSHLLSHDDLMNAAADLKVDVATIFAVKEIESRGNGFLEDGRPVILFERHVMRRQLKKHGFNGAQISEFKRLHSNIVSGKTGGYKGKAGAYRRRKIGVTIHPQSALESCSYGLFQIMGYHWERLEFSSVEDYVDFVTQSEGNQLATFVTFIKTNTKLWGALRNHSWALFAKIYNGKGYKKHHYDKRLAAAYSRYQANL